MCLDDYEWPSHEEWHLVPLDYRMQMIPLLAEDRSIVRELVCPHCGEKVLHALFALGVDKDLQDMDKSVAIWECLLCWEMHEDIVPVEKLRSEEMVDARTGEVVEISWREK